MLKRTLLLLTLLGSMQLSATHILGGEITWDCKNNGKYQFTLSIYRDCGGISPSTAPQLITNNAGASINCSFVRVEDAIQSCYNDSGSCSGSTTGSGRIQRYIYQSNDISLIGAPPTSGWNFTWTSCCRSSAISNGASGQAYLLRATMFPFTPSGTTSALSSGNSGNSTCYDSSPRFLENPQTAYCVNQNATFNNYGIDNDMDSLFYDWANPVKSDTMNTWTPVNFSTGYSFDNPLPSGVNSTAASINHTTGKVTFNSAITGFWTTCIKIEEWRCGQKIGEVFRDVPVATLTCTTPTGLCSSAFQALPPSVSIVSQSNHTLTPIVNQQNDTTHYEIYASLGDSVSVTLSATDPWPNPDCTSQKIQFNGIGAALSLDTIYQTDSTAIGVSAATVNSLNPGNTFTFPGINDVQFKMIIDQTHIKDFQNTCENEDYNIYPFIFRFKDNQCPIPMTTEILVKVYVDKRAPELPASEACILKNSNSHQLKWIPNQDTGKSWGYYLISGIDSSGNALNTDTLSDWSDSTYHDNLFFLDQYVLKTANALGIISRDSIIFKLHPSAPVISSATFDGQNNLVVSWEATSSSIDWVIFNTRDSSNNWSSVDSIQLTTTPTIQSHTIASTKIDTLNITGVGISVRDKCGNISALDLSSSVCIVNLSAQLVNNSWNLNWSEYCDSVESSFEYNILAQYSSGTPYTTIGTSLSTSFSDPLDTSYKSVCYRIEVAESNSGDVLTTSNSICFTGLGNQGNINDLISIFPNPTRGTVFIKQPVEYNSKGCRVRIINQLGLSIFDKNLVHTVQKIDLTTITSKGAYQLLIEDPQGHIVASKTIFIQ